MISKIDKNSKRVVRHQRVRNKIEGTSERPRLCVNRSLNEIYAQIIDDVKGITLVSASTRDKEIASLVKGKNKTEQAKIVGQELAKRAKAKKVKEVVFYCCGYIYIGRVQALAEGAREAGLKF